MIKNNKQAQGEVKGTKEMFESMKVGDKIKVNYKFEQFGRIKERALTILAYGGTQLSIRATNSVLGSMNIEKVTKTRLRAYSYDLMLQKTTYNFKFEDMSIIND
jgi:hypothetical protein